MPGRSNPKAIEIAVPSLNALFAEFHSRPIIERSRTDEQAVKTALRADFLAHSGSHLKAARFSHRERLSAFIGIAILLISIVVSTTLERLTGNVIVAGIAQGIVVLGWVALWAPAQRSRSTSSPTGSNDVRMRGLRSSTSELSTRNTTSPQSRQTEHPQRSDVPQTSEPSALLDPAPLAPHGRSAVRVPALR